MALGIFLLLVEYVSCGQFKSTDGGAVGGMAASMQAYQSTFYAFTQTQGCVQCHGGNVHPAFAAPDIATAYAQVRGNQIGSTKPLIDFYAPSTSIIIQYAGNGHCAATPCSDPSVRPMVQNLLATWSAAEIANGTAGPDLGPSAYLPNYLTDTQPIPPNLPDITSTATAIVRFDLSNLTPAVPALAGVYLEVQIIMINPTEYRVSDLRIAGNLQTVNLTGIHILLNTSTGTGVGSEDPSATATLWDNLSVSAPPTPLPSPLPTGPMTSVTPLTATSLDMQMLSASDVMTIGIDTITVQ